MRVVDLVERLRAVAAGQRERRGDMMTYGDPDPWLIEAADEIERLREALQPFADVAIREDAESPLRVWPDDYWKDDIPICIATNYSRDIEVGDMRRARKALEAVDLATVQIKN